MKSVAFLVAAAGVLVLTGCTTTSTDPNVCTGYERGRLNGLKVGTGIKTPNPETEEGRRVLSEIATLEAKCPPS